MKVKRYIGNTAHEIMQKVKEDLGADAVIINTRSFRRKGWFKWFSRPMVEIVAAVDEQTKVYDSQIFPTGSGFLGKQNASDVTFQRLENRLEDMNSLLKNLIEAKSIEEKKQRFASAEVEYFYNQLLENDVHVNVVEMLIEKATELHENTQNSFEESLKLLILSILGKPQPISEISKERKVIVFIGPTGVGKTTTLAKLAAILSLKKDKKVALITADTYRIAAADQLRIYSDILGIPLTVIYSTRDIKSALNIYSDKDIVLIDTAGKNINDVSHHEEIEELVKESGATEIYITIASNISYLGYMQIVEKYKFLHDYKLIFTKMDEATAYGIILNLSCLAGKPISYITTGQSVPDDIELFDPEKIVKVLMGR